MPATGNLRETLMEVRGGRCHLLHVAAKTSKRIQKSSFSVGKRIHIRVILCLCLFCLLVRVFLCCSSKKMGYGLVKASAEQVRKKWFMRHVAAKTSKRIQKSSFFVGKRIHIRVILCLCKGCKRMPVVTVMT